VCNRTAHFAADTNHNTCERLRGFARRQMHPLLYRASDNHRGHCKPFNANFSTLVYLQINTNSHWLNSSPAHVILYVINLSPINAKLTSLSYVNASESVHGISVTPPTFSVTTVTIATATCISLILPINHQLSLFLFYSSLPVISKLLVIIMPFYNWKLDFVRRCGK